MVPFRSDYENSDESIDFSGTARYKSQIYPIHSKDEEKTEEESKPKEEEANGEEMKVDEAVDTKEKTDAEEKPTMQCNWL